MNSEVNLMSKKSIGQIISEKFDIPLEGIASVPTVQIVGNNIVSVDGCMGIKKYETDEIVILTKNYLLKFTGCSLSMLTFSEGRISIRGTIMSYSIECVNL